MLLVFFLLLCLLFFVILFLCYFLLSLEAGRMEQRRKQHMWQDDRLVHGATDAGLRWTGHRNLCFQRVWHRLRADPSRQLRIHILRMPATSPQPSNEAKLLQEMVDEDKNTGD